MTELGAESLGMGEDPEIIIVPEHFPVDVIPGRPADGERRPGTDVPTMTQINRRALGGLADIADSSDPVPAGLIRRMQHAARKASDELGLSGT